MRHITFQIYINLYKLEFRLFIIVLLLLIYLENWEKKKILASLKYDTRL